ncbi:MAG: GIY-YIG nuclease family protein, partial [Candidatus Hydrothermae bacterium]|nr:GIY-YIG nuclease family protein [Candidatus Hydrothermae bacterium]
MKISLCPCTILTMSRTSNPPWLDRIREAPDRPGVYLFLGDHREILYVGKARSLRQRLASYRQITGRKVAMLHRHARDVEWWVTDAEASALLLEAQLIRHHKPPYNIRLRENRGYADLRLTVQEPFPRLAITRQPTDDGALYLGPYPEIGALRKSLRILRQAFPLRTCTLDLPPRRPLPPCLDYHLGLCGAPCAGLEDE